MHALSLLGLKILLFLIGVAFHFYEFFVLMRFLLQAVKADFRNPFCQFLIKVTAFPLHPLRRIIPGLYGLDLAALVLFYFAVWVEFSLVSVLVYDYWSAFSVIKAILIGTSFYLSTIFFFVLINAILSWVPQAKFHPIGILIHLISEPYLRWAKRILPKTGTFDFSPLLVIVVIQILEMIIQYFQK